MRQRLPLLIALVVAVLVLALLLIAPSWIVNLSGGTALDAAERSTAIREERRTLLAVVAAVGAAVTLWYTHQRHQLDRAKQELDRDANRTDRFTKAVDQLGDDVRPAVQLGGVYALRRVAADSLRDRSPTLQVLSAFVRQRAAELERETPASPTGETPELKVPCGWAGPPGEPILAALDVLMDQDWQGSTAPDLRGIKWAGVFLRGHKLAGANLDRASLSGADLQRADLSGASMHSGSSILSGQGRVPDLVRRV